MPLDSSQPIEKKLERISALLASYENPAGVIDKRKAEVRAKFEPRLEELQDEVDRNPNVKQKIRDQIVDVRKKLENNLNMLDALTRQQIQADIATEIFRLCQAVGIKLEEYPEDDVYGIVPSRDLPDDWLTEYTAKLFEWFKHHQRSLVQMSNSPVDSTVEPEPDMQEIWDLMQQIDWVSKKLAEVRQRIKQGRPEAALAKNLNGQRKSLCSALLQLLKSREITIDWPSQQTGVPVVHDASGILASDPDFEAHIQEFAAKHKQLLMSVRH